MWNAEVGTQWRVVSGFRKENDFRAPLSHRCSVFMLALVCVAAALRAVACLSRAGCGDRFVTGTATCRRQAATPVSRSVPYGHRPAAKLTPDT